MLATPDIYKSGKVPKKKGSQSKSSMNVSAARSMNPSPPGAKSSIELKKDV